MNQLLLNSASKYLNRNLNTQTSPKKGLDFSSIELLGFLGSTLLSYDDCIRCNLKNYFK